MLRTAASRTLRQVGPQARRGAPLVAPRLQDFHVSVRREEEAKAVEPAQPEKGWYNSLYGISLGMILAVPAIKFEWYLVNEETQLAACFVAFCGVMYGIGGDAIYNELMSEGKEVLKKTNAAEDNMIHSLEDAIVDLKNQQGLLSEMEAMKELKAQTYVKMNETGKVKPLYAYKAQMEKLLSIVAAEELAGKEKAKMALMEEATANVRSEFSSNKALQKSALTNAVAQLKGSGDASDPVKDAYLAFFATKKKAAESIDEKSEIVANRAALITKMNTVAMTEKFCFEFDSATGKPKMVA